MFQGETAITVDDKGRMAVPTAYRDLVARASNNRLVLTYNPFDYKKDLGIATPDEEAALLAFKQYVIAVCDYKNQPGYPYTIIWPTVPFPMV